MADNRISAAFRSAGIALTGAAFDFADLVMSAFETTATQLAALKAGTGLAAGAVVPTAVGMTVINKTGVSIAAFQTVAITTVDATSGVPKIVLADADVAGHDNLWVTTAAIADSAQGTVVKSVLTAANINTNAAAAAGDAVYLDATSPGGFTVTPPATAVSRVVPIGYVVVKSLTVGQILFLIGPTRKNAILDAIGSSAFADWVPADASGAGLVFTNVTGRTITIFGLTFAFGSVTYPVTADGTTAAITLPSIPRDLANFRYAGIVVATDEATLTQMNVLQHVAKLQPTTSTGATMANSVLSSNIVRFLAIYEAETLP